jgi:SAM-dependent methyltransferase
VSRTADERYVHGHAEAVLRSHRSRTAENSAAYLLTHLRPGMSLLDVGCGPGTITADLARLVAPGLVTAIDPSPEAVEAARRAIERGGAPAVDVAVGDVYSWGREAVDDNRDDDPVSGTAGGGPSHRDRDDRRYDVVHAHQVLQHVPDPVLALHRMRSMLTDGGLVAARDGDYAAFTWYPAVPALDDWLALYRGLARRSGGEPDAGRRLLSWARAAGFTDVTASASAWCYASAESRAWWGGMWADRIVASSIAEQAVATGEATVADLQRIRAGWQEWAAAEDGWFLVPHGEILCRAT